MRAFAVREILFELHEAALGVFFKKVRIHRILNLHRARGRSAYNLLNAMPVMFDNPVFEKIVRSLNNKRLRSFFFDTYGRKPCFVRGGSNLFANLLLRLLPEGC